MVICDTCDRGFHTYCLLPPVADIPKNGFKCERCRICMDCGLRQFSLAKVYSSEKKDAVDHVRLLKLLYFFRELLFDGTIITLSVIVVSTLVNVRLIAALFVNVLGAAVLM